MQTVLLAREIARMMRWDGDSKGAVNRHFASVTELHRTMGYIGPTPPKFDPRMKRRNPPQTVFGASRIHLCRNATRAAVHESGATPSLTTSRHLLVEMATLGS
jgi:hypothetical protein